MLQLGLANDHFKDIDMRLAMIQSVLRGYNTSGQLISSVKDTYVGSLNAKKVTQVKIANPF